MIRECEKCKAKNRVQENGKVPKCGKCHEPLLPSFFLRFYEQPKFKIEHCMNMIRLRGHKFIEEWGPVSISVNPLVPKNSTQVDMYFDTIEERDKFKKDKLALDIYGQHNGVGNVVLRNPGDQAWTN